MDADMKPVLKVIPCEILLKQYKKKKKKTLKFAHVQQKLSVNIYYLLMTEVSFLFDVASLRLN